ncbi:hypothetical protein ccbrp13_04160 [Ktedonobacteria bacterium brp13]|nr:hypothetical protein ccbrp13_04160 [Ktedonobacteria bacterium brp13]
MKKIVACRILRLLSRFGAHCPLVELELLNVGPYLMITSKKEQRLYDEIERSLHDIEKREFPARPLEPARCPTCPFFFICPA